MPCRSIDQGTTPAGTSAKLYPPTALGPSTEASEQKLCLAFHQEKANFEEMDFFAKTELSEHREPSLSAYLPTDYDAGRSVGLIAGREQYPLILAKEIRQAGVALRLIAFEGETSDELWESFAPEHRARIKVGQVGKMLKALKKLDVQDAIMAGQISPGRLFRDLHPDLKAIQILARLKNRNADTIFGALQKEIEQAGIRLLDARAFMDAHLAHEGLMTGGKLKADPDSIHFGIRMAKAIARLDIGQGVVVRKGTVLAVEAFEGTDDMLARANKYRTDRLIFVKTPKPGQNWRFDVPVFGIKTLETMNAAGIQTACLEAGATLILNRSEVLTEARRQNIEIYGYTSTQAAALLDEQPLESLDPL